MVKYRDGKRYLPFWFDGPFLSDFLPSTAIKSTGIPSYLFMGILTGYCGHVWTSRDGRPQKTVEYMKAKRMEGKIDRRNTFRVLTSAVRGPTVGTICISTSGANPAWFLFVVV